MRGNLQMSCCQKGNSSYGAYESPTFARPAKQAPFAPLCMGVTKLLFGLRTCQLMYAREVVSVFDKGLRGPIEDIIVCGDPLDGRPTLRPANILVFGWEGEKHSCVDLIRVSPLVGLRYTGFVSGHVALKGESDKVAKKACLENQHVFTLFAFDTFRFLAPEAVNFLNRVQRVTHSNIMTPMTQNIVFSRIGFAILKGVLTQLVSRLPASIL
ncbi:hypothetical protein R6Q57_014824 [Mikania cordata]